MEINDDKIQVFWQWFVKNEPTIKESIVNANAKQREYVVEQLNEHILSMGIFSWDIGMDDEDRWFLMISPNANPDMLVIADQIMTEAPDHMEWLFYSGRPAQNWDRQFTVFNEDLDEVSIDASPWHFLMFDADDGTVELVIEVQNLTHLDTEVGEMAVEQFLIGELGESTLLLKISSLVVVEEFEAEDQAEKLSIAILKEHIG